MAENNSSAPLKTAPEDFLDGVNITRLREALVFLGKHNGIGEGEVGANISTYVNSLADGVLRCKSLIRSAQAQAVEAQAAPAAVAVPASWADIEDDRPTSRADLERVMDEWNDTTGALPRDSGWRAEVLGMLHDAYDLGAHQATPALPATEDSSAGDQAEPIFSKAYFGLGAEDIDKMRDAGLKPEEIAGDDPETQLRRVHELVWWFSRFADGNANPKWLRGHAFELAYYIACMDVKRQINLDEVRKKAFKEGAMVSPSERSSLEFTGFLPPLAAPQAEVQAEPVALHDDAYTALQFVESQLAAIANRQFQSADTIEPVDTIAKAAKRAKAALNRLQSVAHHFDTAPQAQPADALDAARYRWLARKVSGHGVIDGWAFGFPTHLTLPAPSLVIRDPEAALGQAIDAAMAAAQEGGNAAKEA